MMKRKSAPPKARAGLIRSFELKRRKQSENSNRVPAKSLGDGTAVAAGAPSFQEGRRRSAIVSAPAEATRVTGIRRERRRRRLEIDSRRKSLRKKSVRAL